MKEYIDAEHYQSWDKVPRLKVARLVLELAEQKFKSDNPDQGMCYFWKIKKGKIEELDFVSLSQLKSKNRYVIHSTKGVEPLIRDNI